MTTIIEITAIRPPKEGKKMATVVAATGQSFHAFPNVIAKLKEGQFCEVDIEETEFNNRPFRKITKAKEVMPTERGIISKSDPRPQPSATAGADQEVAFVTSTLNAFIAAGKVNLDARELGQATQLLRMLWSHSFGAGLSTFHASEAGTRN